MQSARTLCGCSSHPSWGDPLSTCPRKGGDSVGGCTPEPSFFTSPKEQMGSTFARQTGDTGWKQKGELLGYPWPWLQQGNRKDVWLLPCAFTHCVLLKLLLLLIASTYVWAFTQYSGPASMVSRWITDLTSFTTFCCICHTPRRECIRTYDKELPESRSPNMMPVQALLGEKEGAAGGVREDCVNKRWEGEKQQTVAYRMGPHISGRVVGDGNKEQWAKGA